VCLNSFFPEKIEPRGRAISSGNHFWRPGAIMSKSIS
jgi:hypothetical protein